MYIYVDMNLILVRIHRMSLRQICFCKLLVNSGTITILYICTSDFSQGSASPRQLLDKKLRLQR